MPLVYNCMAASPSSYSSGTGGVQRWGSNSVDIASYRANESVYSTDTFYMEYSTLVNATPYETGYAPGDSGGGTFIKDGSTWKLAGVNVYATSDQEGGPYTGSLAASIPTYATEILAAIPEPATLLLLIGGSLAMVLRRRSR